MLEAYQAFGDYETMMELVQGMVCHVAENVLDTLVIEHNQDDAVRASIQLALQEMDEVSTSMTGTLLKVTDGDTAGQFVKVIGKSRWLWRKANCQVSQSAHYSGRHRNDWALPKMKHFHRQHPAGRLTDSRFGGGEDLSRWFRTLENFPRQKSLTSPRPGGARNTKTSFAKKPARIGLTFRPPNAASARTISARKSARNTKTLKSPARCLKN